MVETLGVFGAVALLALLGWLGPAVSALGWMQAGAVCIGAGLLLGVPTGVVYHWRLAAVLRARECLPARWWLRPVSLHGRLLPGERRSVHRWFFLGGAGFLLTLLGCALVVWGVAMVARG
ncbi:MAG: hypothetical protein AAF430_16230 [Myxococcota bacterium]